MNKIAKLLIPATAALFLTGCSSTQYGAANIYSTPEGAEIANLKDNSHLGVTPAKISFPGKPDTAEQVTIQLQKPGYLDRITSFWINRRHDSRAEALAQPIDVKVELEQE